MFATIEGNQDLNHERTAKHSWLIGKRDSLINKINNTTDEDARLVLELLRDLYSYLIEADGNFSDNLKNHFEEVEAQLPLNPTSEDMLRGHASISEIKNELRSELKINSEFIEKRLINIEAQHHLVITGQNEIISTQQSELKCIDTKLDNITFLLLQQNATNLSQQATHIKQVEDKIDTMGIVLAKVQDNLRLIERMVANPLLNQFFVGIGVVCFLF
jgi:hypothetical protein